MSWIKSLQLIVSVRCVHTSNLIERAIIKMEQYEEITREEMIDVISSIPLNEGGFPKWMLEENIMVTVDMLNERLNRVGIKLMYVK